MLHLQLKDIIFFQILGIGPEWTPVQYINQHDTSSGFGEFFLITYSTLIT